MARGTIMPNEDFPCGQSRQVAALVGKTISYQKRQMFTNICCISLCPFVMVSIAGILGSVISTLINRANRFEEFVSCSNITAMDAQNIPLWNRSDPNIPKTTGKGLIEGATQDTIQHTNFVTVVSLRSNGPPGAASLGFQHPCVFWYGEDYPSSSVYEQNYTAPGLLGRDAAFLAQPRSGWFTALTNATTTPRTLQIFSNKQQRAYTLYGADPSVDSSLLGSKPQQPLLSLGQFFALNATAGRLSFTAASNASFPGLLGTIPTRYFVDITSSGVGNTSVSGLQAVPWYNLTSGTSDSIDDAIAASLNEVIAKIAAEDKSALLQGNGDTAKIVAANQLLAKLSGYLKVLPHGGVYFTKIDHTAKKYSWIYHHGTDIRLTGSSNFPPPGPRILLQQTQLDNAILRTSNATAFGNASITQGIRVFPQLGNSAINLPFGGLIGAILYPFGVSFLLPIFSITLVQEKEQRILVMMNMNGLKAITYYLSHYVTFFILYVLSILFFTGAGVLFKLTMFTLTSPGVYILLFFLWGNAQISLAFFFSTLFNKSRIALVIVFLLVLCSVIISFVIESLYEESGNPSLGYFIWPPFAFYRGLSIMNLRSYSALYRPYAMSDLVAGDEMLNILIFLAWEIPAYLLFALYLNFVFPTEFGVRKPWHFPITDPINAFMKAKRTSDNGGVDPKAEGLIAVNINDGDEQLEDDDVRAERERVLSNKFDPESPLIMKSMRKVYAGRGGAGPKLAVKDVTFAVERGIVFGLLGPNGAGKTTLISILTGLYEASHGQATLAGFDIKKDTADVYQKIGICPQFDILWDDLTVSEHLTFYARLKGIPRSHEKSVVEKAMQWVSLIQYRNTLSKSLSGGEKRRLSIAISLIGNPQVVFLDEPTTGLDPEVRRLIWNIVNEARQDKTVVLTTHSMEEAEALCQRIGIMAKGRLRCIANPIRLKEKYGSGFKLYFNTSEEHTSGACAYIESILPQGWKKMDAFATNTSYEFPPSPGILGKLFIDVEANKERVHILDWGIGQTTLEEVFIDLISEADAAAEA